ncbi:hypothetical protein J2W56_004230 [Nocardia kruczakiae]|uniref:Uncharacterized protein n=1 Tax=Nocardia kruczakiae TaxID=261477 RepID=A0ABU1XJI0_9NOCA|nr:hypothetical protein [Nocardia kruczakiae]
MDAVVQVGGRAGGGELDATVVAADGAADGAVFDQLGPVVGGDLLVDRPQPESAQRAR